MSAESVYSSYLDELRDTASFVRTCVALRPVVATFMRRGEEAHADQLVKAYLSSPQVESRVYQSFLVAAHAGFEQFFVSLLEDVCALINDSGISASDLEKKIPGFVNRFRRVSGTALTGIFEPKEHWKLDFEGLVGALSSTLKSAQKATLMGRVFVVEGGSVDGDSVKKKLAACGCKFDWDEVGRQPEIAAALEVSGVRAVGKAAKDMIDDLCRKRNALAHSQGSLSVDAQELLKYLLFYGAFSRYLSKLLLSHVSASLK